MTRTSDAGGVALVAHVVPEVCPVCASLDVRAFEADWFALELDRAAQVRGAGEVRGVTAVRFGCRDCGTAWD